MTRCHFYHVDTRFSSRPSIKLLPLTWTTVGGVSSQESRVFCSCLPVRWISLRVCRSPTEPPDVPSFPTPWSVVGPEDPCYPAGSRACPYRRSPRTSVCKESFLCSGGFVSSLVHGCYCRKPSSLLVREWNFIFSEIRYLDCINCGRGFLCKISDP